jgi:RNA-directed DNA polymerase
MELLEGKMSEPSTSGSVSTKQQRIATLATYTPKMVMRSLLHHVDVDWLREAYNRTRKDGAVGVDGQTAAAYAANLEDNLRSLLDRAKSGDYFAPPVRRVHIPKDGGTTRPIGIPTFEDKVLQRAVVMALEPVYEQDFLDGSYGFRRGRSQHDALGALWKQTTARKGGWILEVDIRSYFDALDHACLREIIQRRVRDGVLLRLIGKWLNAGVLEERTLSYPERGTPQGGVISPMLANIYLHDVLDMWFEEEVKPRLRGASFLVRFADDFVMGFANEEDARRVFEVLPKRFEKHGLTLHPDKTRLFRFQRPSGSDDDPGTFNFLGFTHYWGTGRKGQPVLKRKTMSARLSRSLRRIGEFCRVHRHDRMAEQHAALVKKVRGHYAYYGITGNAPSLTKFLHGVERIWQRWLSRRSQRAKIRWSRFQQLLRVFPLPPPRVVHSIYRVAKP